MNRNENYKVQVIKNYDNKPLYALVPYKEYKELYEKLEDLEDISDYDRIKKKLKEGKEELIPAKFVDRILDGENEIKVFRDLRMITQSELAKKVGVSKQYISSIEGDKIKGSKKILNKIAKVLNVNLEDII
jgi:DNA-binding XRE family transcriptional regulator